MKRVLGFTYGVVSYAVFFGTFLYAIGFVGNIFVPKTIDGPAEGPLGIALAINCALLGVFALQHSVMARPGFKKWWTKIIPEPLERSTYTLLSSLALILLFWQWRPIGGMVWNIQDHVGQIILFSVFALGWLTVLVTTFMINHFDLFGLRQSWLYLRGKEYTPLGFMTPGPYKYIRHPLYVGWFLAFWATPTMSATHLLFAIGTTVYVLVAIIFEERDLVKGLGAEYEDYRENVPMFVPSIGKRYEPQRHVARQNG